MSARRSWLDYDPDYAARMEGEAEGWERGFEVGRTAGRAAAKALLAELLGKSAAGRLQPHSPIWLRVERFLEGD